MDDLIVNKYIDGSVLLYSKLDSRYHFRPNRQIKDPSSKKVAL